MTDATIVGTTGAVILLNAFVLNQTGKWKTSDFGYDLSNFIGSLLLIIYAVIIAAYPFLILNLIWGYVSLKDVFKSFKQPE